MLPRPPSHEMPARLVRLVIGLILFGVGLAWMVLADLGLAPWEVLHQGISRRTGILIGTTGIIVGALVLLAWIPLRERMGIGTILNVAIVGVVIDLTLWALPSDLGADWLRWAAMLGGVLLVGIGTGFYIGAGLGPGPRDGLMTGIAAKGIPIGLARTVIELSVLVGGWMLGGTVGIGTVLFAFGVGPSVAFFLPRLTRPVAASA